MTTENLTLLLDFDGVLHPLWEPAPFNDWTLEQIFGPKAYAGPFFIHAPILVDLLRPVLDSIDIVVSSTWGRTRDLATLQGLLPAELAARLTDAVHHHLPAPGQRKDPATRWGEIDWYLRHVRPHIGDRWLAIDDNDWQWPMDQRHHLIHCSRDLGDPASQKAMRDALVRVDPRRAMEV